MITNVTTNSIISQQETYCKSILSQARGLMFRKKHNLIMELKKPQKISLHNFFVFYPIDVILLDEHKQVIEIKQNFKPFTFYSSDKRAKYVIELANLDSDFIQVSHQLNF